VADSEHLVILHNGSRRWNLWREENPHIRPDLSNADLSSERQDLEELTEARINWNVLNVDPDELIPWSTGENDPDEVSPRDPDLIKATPYKHGLMGANLTGVLLNGANLAGANLSDADLDWSDLSGADLRNTNLCRTNLTGADLRSASLQKARLNHAILTDAQLWETQRAGWSILGVICERAFWDRNAKEPSLYKPGEFERLHSEQTCIELFYQNGVSTFELSTLPALLQRLATKHPNANIRLKTIEETGGGAKITISLGDASPEVAESIQADAARAQHLQLALRGREDELIDLKAALRATERAYDKLLDKWSDSRGHQITIDRIQGTLQLGDHASADYRAAVFNDTAPLIQLLTELLAAQPASTIAAAAQTAKAELQKPTPDKPALKRSLEFLKDLATEAVKKGAGKLGERAASTDWPALHHQITQFLHHLS
jgi:uncharacterized protein YjbI with pentapeptide repeats